MGSGGRTLSGDGGVHAKGSWHTVTFKNHLFSLFFLSQKVYFKRALLSEIYSFLEWEFSTTPRSGNIVLEILAPRQGKLRYSAAAESCVISAPWRFQR